MTIATLLYLTPVLTNRDHAWGPVSAPITLVEYGDYACPHCSAARFVVEHLRSALRDRLRFAYRNVPMLTSHGYFHRAAEAAEAAAAQNKFWEMHDFLYDHQFALSDRHLKFYVTQLGLDMERFNRDMMLQNHAVRVYEDILSAAKSGVCTIPAFFVNNGRYLGPCSVESLLSSLEEVNGSSLPQIAGMQSDGLLQ